ncbi:formyltransferase family protein [Pyxidicoccus trucidator]|uniref:formyltransferase family protein n=1 Tax=Pyxidicoccus trucidator TaxID=2709662 RepID=UPI0013DCCDDC|nr:formyltransferase family protein [Pyxidicoccus trucidator]
MKPTFSCCIIGRGELAIQCAELLLAEGHRLQGLISEDRRMAAWAEQHHIPRVPTSRDLIPGSPLADIDYLFSIITGEILEAPVLSLPRRLAINIHNGPLPRYAGVHATSWAILNGERVFGVTWHVMTERIDAGDILKQVLFPVGERDTAETLSRAGTRAAVESFRELIAELAAGTAVRRPQDLTQRTYFAWSRCHPSLGRVSWEQEAEDIDRIVRAHTLGMAPNALGLPWCVIGGEPFVPRELEPTDVRSTAAPGTLLQVGAVLRIATATQDMLLRSVSDFDGGPRSAAALTATYGLREGDRLPPPDAASCHAVEHLRSLRQPQEAFWLRELAAAPRTELPATGDEGPDVAQALTPPPTLPREAEASWSAPLEQCLLTALLVELAREAGVSTVCVGLSTPATRAAGAGLERFVARFLPLTVELRQDLRFPEAVRAVQARVAQLEAHAPCARDLPLRYPARGLLLARSVTVLLGGPEEPPKLEVASRSREALGRVVARARALLSAVASAPDLSLAHLDGSGTKGASR